MGEAGDLKTGVKPTPWHELQKLKKDPEEEKPGDKQ
jgi:hypothetical protein